MEGTFFVLLFTTLRLVIPVAAVLTVGEVVRRREERRTA